MSNIEVINTVCKSLREDPDRHIAYVADRPGHDREYRITNSILKNRTSFEDAVRQTVEAGAT